MLRHRLVLLSSILSILSACADYSTGQPPAPVFGGPTVDNNGYPPSQPSPGDQAQSSPQPEIIETKPLEGYNRVPEVIELKPEIPPPAETNTTQPDAEQSGLSGQPPELNDAAAPEPATGDQAATETQPPAEEQKPAESVTPVAPPLPEAPKEPETLVPLESFAPQSPAVGALVTAANENSQGGNLDSAVSSIERAIRIEPRNATLYYKLAVLRLKQSKPRLAEDLARKAAILAVNDNALKKHSWLLIANAREQQQNPDGAKKAKLEASKF